VAGLAPGVEKSRAGARERSLSFIFVLIAAVTIVQELAAGGDLVSATIDPNFEPGPI
jgi:hypothetical protein